MAARAVPAPLAHLPNALTVLRLALIPVFVVVVLGTGGEGSWGAAALFAAAGATPLPAVQAWYEREVQALRAKLDPAEFAAAWAEGQALPLERAIAEALGEDVAS